MPRASGDLWNAGNVVLMCMEIMLKNDKTVLLLLFSVIFLKELVLELIECPSYMNCSKTFLVSVLWTILMLNVNYC